MAQIKKCYRCNHWSRSFLLLALFLSACGKVDLYQDLNEKEANEFVVKLAESGIAATKEIVPAERGAPTFKIQVEKDKLSAAQKALEHYGLPRDVNKGVAHVYPGGGLIPGIFEEKAKYLLAVSGDLELTLNSIDRVVDSHVHVVIPEESVLKDEDEGTIRPTASVLLKYIPKDGKKPIEEDDIRKLVARAVEGLDIKDVAVVTVPVDEPAAVAPVGTSGVSSSELSFDQFLEKYKTELAARFVDKTEVKPFGPIQIKKDTYNQFLIGFFVLVVLSVVFAGLSLFGLLRASSLKKRLGAQQQQRVKAKKPTSNP